VLWYFRRLVTPSPASLREPLPRNDSEKIYWVFNARVRPRDSRAVQPYIHTTSLKGRPGPCTQIQKMGIVFLMMLLRSLRNKLMSEAISPLMPDGYLRSRDHAAGDWDRIASS
jgi:hypothetical protein